jgi:protocatechuate 3,4-dioxygenase beta subunit
MIRRRVIAVGLAAVALVAWMPEVTVEMPELKFGPTYLLAQGGVFMGQRPGPRIGPRDNQAPQVGTGRLRGRVVGGDTGMPLRRAIVRLSGQDFREGRVASTDEEGRWELKDLPAGRYTLSASKGGYVQLQFGQRRPFEQGRPIELGDGQTLENVNFNLPRGSVIAGRIVDEFGEPVAEAMVVAMRYRYINGRRRLVPAGRFAQTDDGGHFRIYGLPPGDYYLSATLREGPMLGFEVGDGITSYAPTYYPGTGSAQQAERISVGLGAEMSGVTFSLLPVKTVKVSGTAIDSTGRPMAGAFVMLREDVRMGEGGMMMMMGGGNRVKDDGTFLLTNIAPGDYVVEVRQMMMGPGRRGGDEPEVAFTTLSVGSEDVTGVSLIGTRGTSIRGRVTLQPAAAASGVKPSEISVSAMAQDADAPMMFLGRESRDGVNDDWSFEVRAVQSPVLLRTFRLPAGYTLKAVLVGGQDVTDRGIAFKTGEPVTGVEIVVSASGSSLSGGVTDDAGQPVPDYAVVVYAEDREHWGFMSRHIKLARPDQQGAYQVKDLPAGRYLAVAVEAMETGEESDPAMLERLRPLATAFSLGEGEQRALNLKLVRAY